MNTPLLNGIRKRAGAESVNSTDIEAFLKTLQPGDVLLTRPKRMTGPGRFLFQTIGGQGPWTHVGIHGGDDKIIHMQHAPDALGLERLKRKGRIDDIRAIAARNQILAKRPKNASEEEIAAALESARSLIGKPYNWKHLARAGVLPKRDPLGKSKGSDSAICSELIAKAYPNRMFGARSKEHISPQELFTSPHLKSIAALILASGI